MDYKEFCDIYLPLNERLYRVAYHLLESQDDAEDAVQDLFIKLWNSRDTLSTVGNPCGYAITMMRNLCIDRIRAASRVDMLPMAENAASVDPPDAAVATREQLELVRHVMEKLPESQRQVLEMRAFEELSYEEMSVLTGKSQLNLRVLLAMARNKIRKQL